ncbi:MAG: hypothetical protein A2029_17210 [Chloroflexi bacterium RBG_19FT_COMBO_47_9]|nr:MAG: hypothetical protein A2029_17210 [Chloroflexi bacterium RBG_19FT_COMBO_47_9]
MNNNLEQIVPIATDLGADIVGIANLMPARRFLLEQGNALATSFPIGISFGIVLNQTIVNLLLKCRDRSTAMLYRQHCYNAINIRLDIISSRISNFIQLEGYDALPIPASQTTEEFKLDGYFSHKIAAHLAGLGWIGKNHLLVTPKHGPRVRLATVLTNAPLQAVAKVLPSECGDCSLCADICPSGALDKYKIIDENPNKFYLYRQLCHEYLQKMEIEIGFKVCGLCLSSCPYGR